ncbi:hypothetical protein R83H12_02521 [Fibrobacteria bacterium R8-3-H12]
MYYELLLPYGNGFYNRINKFNLIRIKNDTLAAMFRDSSYNDSLLVTLDGNHIVPKLGKDLCLGVRLKDGTEGYVGSVDCPIKGNKPKCFVPKNVSSVSESLFVYNLCMDVLSPKFKEEWLMDVAPSAVLGGKR